MNQISENGPFLAQEKQTFIHQLISLNSNGISIKL
jgi:hypothetical protein